MEEKHRSAVRAAAFASGSQRRDSVRARTLGNDRTHADAGWKSLSPIDEPKTGSAPRRGVQSRPPRLGGALASQAMRGLTIVMLAILASRASVLMPQGWFWLALALSSAAAAWEGRLWRSGASRATSATAVLCAAGWTVEMVSTVAIQTSVPQRLCQGLLIMVVCQAYVRGASDVLRLAKVATLCVPLCVIGEWYSFRFETVEPMKTAWTVVGVTVESSRVYGGTFSDQNVFSLDLVTWACLAALLLRQGSRKWQLLASLTIAVSGTAVLFTLSRTSVLLAVFATVVLAWLLGLTRPMHVVGAATLAVLLVQAMPEALRYRFQAPEQRSSVDARFELNSSALSAWMESPYFPVFGTGLLNLPNKTTTSQTSHSTWVDIAAAYGFAGLLAAAGMLGRAVGPLLRVVVSRFRQRRQQGSPEAAVLLVACVVQLLAGFSFQAYLQYGFWMCIGLALGMSEALSERGDRTANDPHPSCIE